jgi:hypothetical protein
MAHANNSRLKFSDEIVSCYKDPAELVLFHDIEMEGHIREGSIRWKLVRAFQEWPPAVCRRAETLC